MTFSNFLFILAYDSSGRYRGQIMYGNNLWVGEKHFCIEVNRDAGERKHFDFGFYAANILIKADLPTKMVCQFEQFFANP